MYLVTDEMSYDNQGVTFKDITTTATNNISTASDFSVSIGKTTEPLHPTSVTEVSVSFIDAETTKPLHPINTVRKRGNISVKDANVINAPIYCRKVFEFVRALTTIDKRTSQF